MASVETPIQEENIAVEKSNISSNDLNQENENPNIPVKVPENQSIPLQEISSGAQKSESSVNTAFSMDDEEIHECIPPVTHHDIIPELLLRAETKDQAPQYSRFGTLIDRANQWLKENPRLMLWKCETVVFKLGIEENIDTDHVYYLESAYGSNIFLAGLRLWLVPRPSPDIPVEEIGYTSALPGRQTAIMQGQYESRINVSEGVKLTDMIGNLNKQIMKNPLPGNILNVETVVYRVSTDFGELLSVDPDETCWAEHGQKTRTVVHGLRIYYIKGKPQYVTIGFHDEQPDIADNSFGTSIKFLPFRRVVGKMGMFLRKQKNIRVLNLQSVNVKFVMDSRGFLKVEHEDCTSQEPAHIETRYCKILRSFFQINSTKSAEQPYKSLSLSTRLFVPVRVYGREFESWSKTMMRLTKWMNYAKVPPFGVETVQYQIYIDGYNTPVLEDKIDSSIRRNMGRYHLSTIRMYFPSEYEEPPTEVSPEVDTGYASSWGCSIS
ncbi:uncharacterized protein LOC133192718 [Saccostrea echinata]|uniref:uncharacterized protein LOC133192718 n=1 Tax=Saccostrea echinata TaxID=191078 RepID=UPI002A828FBC|nr:uncharacterized protein LOC133192718 [Saccostrea echinata]